MSYTIKHLFHINSPIENVFDALSDIEKLKEWYTTETSGESKLNGIINFRFGEIDFKIQILEYEKNKKITKYIIEVKPKKQTQPPNEKNKKTAAYRNAALTYAKNQTKWSAAREYCEDRQMNFLILTEDHLGV